MERINYNIGCGYDNSQATPTHTQHVIRMCTFISEQEITLAIINFDCVLFVDLK